MYARNSIRRLTRKRLAKDGEVSDEKMEKAVTFLTNRLSEEDMLRFKQILQTPDADNEDADNTPTEDEDGPAPFKDMPKPGGSMAADSRGNSYADRFPNAARIKVEY
jgi:hypothetical protein